jgi:L-serine dehydratase
MVASVFDLFKIGVGPSSSHTMGPMTAAADFARRLSDAGIIDRVVRVDAALYGSLALTGKGHATDRAVLLGLAGHVPAAIDPDAADAAIAAIRSESRLTLGGVHEIAFDEAVDLRFLQRERLDFHSNAMTFAAFDGTGAELGRRTYYSVGGGAVLDEDQIGRNAAPEGGWDVPHIFHSGAELLALAEEKGLTIAGLMRANEEATLAPEEVSARLGGIADAMSACIDRGIRSESCELPGGLRVKRRAPGVYRTLIERQERALADPRGCRGFPADRRRDRLVVPRERLYFRRRSRLSGRSRCRLFDGRRWPCRGTRRDSRADRECRGDRHGA